MAEENQNLEPNLPKGETAVSGELILEKPVSSPKKAIMSGLKFLIFLLLSGLLAGGSFWGEKKLQASGEEKLWVKPQLEFDAESLIEIKKAGELNWQELEKSAELKVGDQLRAETGDLLLKFPYGDRIELKEGSQVEIETWNNELLPYAVSLELEKGEIKANNLSGASHFSFLTEKTKIQPEEASVQIGYQEGQVLVQAVRHPSRIEFLENGQVVNQILLGEDYQEKIQESKVTGKISPLKYSKLIKEFPVSFVEMTDGGDEVYREELGRWKNKIRKTKEGGFEVGSLQAKAGDLWFQTKEILTFNFTQKRVVFEDYLKKLFEEAEFEYVIGEKEQGEAKLNFFQKKLEEFQSQGEVSEEFYNFLKNENYFFKTVLPGNDFYSLKTALREAELLFETEPKEKIGLNLAFLRERLNEIYDLTTQNELQLAQNAFSSYQEAGKELLLTPKKELFPFGQNILEERQLLAEFLQHQESFYAPTYFALLSDLEQMVLNLTEDEFDLNEERQTFIQSKLSVFNQLVELLKKDRIGADKVIELGAYLLKEAQNLSWEVSAEVAILGYFSGKIVEYDMILDFLDSTEYLLGEGTFEERFKLYQSKEADLAELSAYLKNIKMGGEVEGSTLTLEEAISEVKNQLRSAQVEFEKVTSLGDKNYRLFKIEGGKVAEIDFEGNYDRDSQIVYDLKIAEQSFVAGVKLENLASVVLGSLGGEEGKEEGEIPVEEKTELSRVEETAIKVAKKYLEEGGVEVEEKNIEILDLDQNLFQVEDAICTRYNLSVDSFKFDVQNLKVIEFGSIRILEPEIYRGEWTLEEFCVEAAWAASLE